MQLAVGLENEERDGHGRIHGGDGEVAVVSEGNGSDLE